MGIIALLNQKIPVPFEKEQLAGGMGGIIQPVVLPAFIFQRIREGKITVTISNEVWNAKCIDYLKGAVHNDALERAKFRSD